MLLALCSIRHNLSFVLFLVAAIIDFIHASLLLQLNIEFFFFLFWVKEKNEYECIEQWHFPGFDYMFSLLVSNRLRINVQLKLYAINIIAVWLTDDVQCAFGWRICFVSDIIENGISTKSELFKKILMRLNRNLPLNSSAMQLHFFDEFLTPAWY